MNRLWLVLAIVLLSLSNIHAATTPAPIIDSVHPFKVFNNGNKIFISGSNFIGVDIKKISFRQNGGEWKEFTNGLLSGSASAIFTVSQAIQPGLYDVKIFSSKSNSESNVLVGALNVVSPSCIQPKIDGVDASQLQNMNMLNVFGSDFMPGVTADAISVTDGNVYGSWGEYNDLQYNQALQIYLDQLPAGKLLISVVNPGCSEVTYLYDMPSTEPKMSISPNYIYANQTKTFTVDFDNITQTEFSNINNVDVITDDCLQKNGYMNYNYYKLQLEIGITSNGTCKFGPHPIKVKVGNNTLSDNIYLTINPALFDLKLVRQSIKSQIPKLNLPVIK